MNDWPLWMRIKLKDDPSLLAWLPAGADGIYGAGALEGPPGKKPFIIIHTDDDARGPFPGMGISRLSVHVHDQPGTYSRIRTILHLCRTILCGQWTEGQCIGSGAEAGGLIRWINDSADLADEGFKTIVRTSQYELRGRDGHD